MNTTKPFDARIESVNVESGLVKFTFRLYFQGSAHPTGPCSDAVFEEYVKLPPDGLRPRSIAELAHKAALEAGKSLHRHDLSGSF